MTINQFLLMLKARYKLALAIFLTVVASATVVTLLMPKTYTANAAVVLDVKSPDPVAGMLLPGMSQPGYMATQIDILRSERVMQGVIKRLNLTNNPDLRRSWSDATKSAPGTFEPWLSTVLLSRMTAAPGKESNVINITFSGRDPAFSSTMANAIVDSYIETTLELRVEPAKQYSNMFAEQARGVRARLEDAQAKLSAYQQKNGLVATDERLDVENQRLADLSSQLVAVQGLRADASSRNSAAATSADRSPEALINPVVSRLNGELALLEAKLKEVQSSLGDAHPTVLQIRANIAELKQRVAEETAKVGASLNVNNRASIERESTIRSALEQQRQRVLALKAQRDEANVLIREVQSAQAAYDRVIARLDQASLESQSTQTNVSIVKRASPPYTASSPNLLVNVGLAAVLGLIFAVGAISLLELIDRRLRSADDLLVTLDLPLLGSLSDSRSDNASDRSSSLFRLTSSAASAQAAPRLAAPTR